MKEIIIEIGEDGQIEIRGEGFKGKECSEKMKFIEDALGVGDGKRKNLPSYYQSETTKLKQRV